MECNKLTKQQKALLIALLIGDGTICSNNIFKLSHSIDQEAYLKWKLKLLDKYKILHNGLHTYISSSGYNKGKGVVYSQLKTISTIKALRRICYKPKKQITYKLLSWLDSLGLAIWYMDDGHLNVNTSSLRRNIQYSVRISTCFKTKKEVQIVIEYFKIKWGINFNAWKDHNKYSIGTTTLVETIKFLNIVKPYIMQVPSLWYKMRNNYTKAEFIKLQQENPKCETLLLI